MNICFNCVFKKCQDLSSFEGRNLTDGEGQSLYQLVHITEQDRFLVHTYADQAVIVMEGEMRHILLSVDYVRDEDTDEYVFEFTEDCYLYKEIEKQMTETIVSYVMQMWLMDKKPERSDAYKLIFAQMIASMRRMAVKKRPTFDEEY